MPNFHELHEAKEKEMREKYAGAIAELSTKYDVDLGVAFDHLKAIAYAELENEPVQYEAGENLDLLELIRDYAELRWYSHKCRAGIELVEAEAETKVEAEPNTEA